MASDSGSRRVTRASTRAASESGAPTAVGPDIPAHNTRAASRAASQTPSVAGSARSARHARVLSQAPSAAGSARSTRLASARSAMATTAVPGSVAGPSRNAATVASGREALTTYGDEGPKPVSKTETDAGLAEFQASLGDAGVPARTRTSADLPAISEEDVEVQGQIAASLQQSVNRVRTHHLGAAGNTTDVQDFEDYDRTYSAEREKVRKLATAAHIKTWRDFDVLKWLSIIVLFIFLLADVYRGPIFGEKYDLLSWRSNHSKALKKPLSFSSADMGLFVNRLEELVKADTGLFSKRLEELVAADTNRLEKLVAASANRLEELVAADTNRLEELVAADTNRLGHFVATETSRLEELVKGNIDLFSSRFDDLGVADKNRLEELVASNMDLFSARLEDVGAENLKRLFNYHKEYIATNMGLLSTRLEEIGQATKNLVSTHVRELDAANERRVEELVTEKLRHLSYTDAPKIHKINWFSPGLGALTAPQWSSPTRIMNRTYEQGSTSRLGALLPFTFPSWVPYLGKATHKLSYEIKEHREIEEALLPWHDIGDCWCAPATRGKLQLAVILPHAIAPTELVIEHMPTGELRDIGSVPKEVELWVNVESQEVRHELMLLILQTIPDVFKPMSQRGKGKNTVQDLGKKFIPLGRWTYDVNSRQNIQTFPIDFDLSAWNVATSRAVVRVNSNWGSKDETCLYRVKLHGKDAAGAIVYDDLEEV